MATIIEDGDPIVGKKGRPLGLKVLAMASQLLPLSLSRTLCVFGV